MATDHVSRYRAAIERFDAGDLDGYVDFYADDVVFGGLTPKPLGKAGVRSFHAHFMASFAGARVEVDDLFGAANRLGGRLLLTGTHVGAFLHVEPTGIPIAMPITTVLTMRDDRCVERWSTADLYGLLVQLNAVPAPPG